MIGVMATVSAASAPPCIPVRPRRGTAPRSTGLAGSAPFHRPTVIRVLALTLIFLFCLPTLVAQDRTNFDGPAELPRVYVKTSSNDTPSPLGANHPPVQTFDELQSAVNRAACGDVIQLNAGTTFTGTLALPAKRCDAAHWITLRTSAPDSSLPPEGTRLTPCYAGVGSLPGRPALNCISTKDVMAKLAGLPPVNAREAVNHYRFIGIEFTQPPGTSAPTLISLHDNLDHIVIDRCWIHGNATDNTRRGVALNGSYLAVVDSTITDIHEVQTDTQGIIAWTGTGPLKIVNNFVEGGSSSIGFGGAPSDTVPRDIEIRRNHLFKPMTWRVRDPGFIGVAFNCKVLLESKNSSRVLIEGNILDNAWGGPQGGDGGAIWLGPKNSYNRCPICEVNDITFRNNIIRHAGGGLYVFDAPSDAGGIAQQAMRYSIHDNLLEDISTDYAAQGSGNGILFRIAGSVRFTPPQDITIQHNTGLETGPRSGLLLVNTSPEVPVVHLVFADNLLHHGEYGITGCKGRYGEDVLQNCTKGSFFWNNVIVGASGNYPKANESSHGKHLRLYPADWRAVKFVNPGSGDYRLCQGKERPAPTCDGPSPYSNEGMDGKDVGADMNAVMAATKDVD